MTKLFLQVILLWRNLIMSFINLKDINRKFGQPEVVVNKFDKWLSSRPYNQRDSILPEFLSDDVPEIDYELARELMYYAVSLGVLQTNYEVYCPKCTVLVEIFQRQMDIPNELESECGYIFNPWNHQDKIVVSFKVKLQDN